MKLTGINLDPHTHDHKGDGKTDNFLKIVKKMKDLFE